MDRSRHSFGIYFIHAVFLMQVWGYVATHPASRIGSSPLLTLFQEANLKGNTAYINDTQTVYSGSAIPGNLNNEISSFILKSGYMVVAADQENGLQPSETYIAVDGPLLVNALPNELDDSISFLRVMPWRQTGKKGVCGGDYQQDIVGVDADWYYKWNKDVPSGQLSTGPEYVPMSWGKGSTSNTAISDYLAMDQVTHLLGFNEPDNSGQSNIPNITQAVQLFALLQEAGLRLGSPACKEEGATKDSSWLSQFMLQADADEVRVDFIDVHWYDWGSSPSSNPDPNPVDVANRLKSYLSNVYAKYRLPIWITEFNANGNRDRSIQDGFLQSIMPYLDDVAYVERFSYYQWGSTMKFFNSDGSITSTGTLYQNHVSPLSYIPLDLPSPWLSADIGTAAVGASLYNGHFTISGSGAGLSGTADGFRYVYQPLAGDVTITALITGQIYHNQLTMAGVMIRESLSRDSKQATMALSWSQGAKYRTRSSTGGTVSSAAVGGIPKYPYWVKLERVRDEVSGYVSPDGESWTQVGPTITIEMTGVGFVGLAVTSYNDGTYNDAIFKEVSVLV